MREHSYFIMFCRKIQQLSQSFPRPKARKKRPPIGGRCALASCKGIKSRRSGKGPDGGGKGVFCGHAAAKRAMVTPPPKKSDIPLQTVPPATAGTRSVPIHVRQDRRAAQRLRNRRRGLTVAQTPRAAGSAEDKQPAGQQHCGQKSSLFSFKGYFKALFHHKIHNRRGTLAPAARSGSPQNRKPALLIRPSHKIVHWTVLLSFKFSQV